MKGETGGFHARCDGVQKTLLAGDLSNWNAFGGDPSIGPGFVEQDGASLCGDPDMIEAQFGGKSLIPRCGP